MERSALGYRRYRVRLPIICKAVIWAAVSGYALIDAGPVIYKFFLAAFIMVILESLRAKRTKALYVFLVLSSVSIGFFWSFFEGGFLSANCQAAMAKVWLLLLSGNLFLYSISLHELLRFLFRIRCPMKLVVAVMIMLNAVNYFMEAFGKIKYGYELRGLSSNFFIKYKCVLQTLSIDFLFLLVECKKIFLIHEKQIEMALMSVKDPLTEGG